MWLCAMWRHSCSDPMCDSLSCVTSMNVTTWALTGMSTTGPCVWLLLYWNTHVHLFWPAGQSDIRQCRTMDHAGHNLNFTAMYSSVLCHGHCHHWFLITMIMFFVPLLFECDSLWGIGWTKSEVYPFLVGPSIHTGVTINKGAGHH